MKLRQTKTLAVFNEHNRSVGHVNTHLNNRCRNKNICIPCGKSIHDFLFFCCFHFPMDTGGFTFRQSSFQLLCIVQNIFHFHFFIFLDHGTDHVSLSACRRFFAQKSINPLAIRSIDANSVDLLSAGGQFVDDGNIQIPIENQCQCTGNGCCRHDKDMRIFPFLCQHTSLAHTETMLFVGNDQTDFVIFHAFLNDRMGTHNHFGCTICDFCQCFPFFFGFHTACEQSYFNT